MPNDSEPYRPCPCGSGRKYKFCCKASGRYKPQPAIRPGRDDDGPGATAVPHPRGPADGLVAYAQDLLDATDGSPAQMQKALDLAMLCWNLAIVDEAKREDALLALRPDFRMTDAEFDEFRRDVIAPMIHRHARMFPDMHRRLGAGT